jgi:alginate biosynthesis protein AlgX
MMRRTCLAAGLASALVCAAALPVAAQSDFGCSNLSGRNSLPAVEGARGVFYRIDPDMFNFHPFAEETVAQMAELSTALAAQGTTLIYVPVPTKGMAMPASLPQLATDLGFDPVLAATVHGEMLRKLTEAGVMTVDLRSVLTAGIEEPPSFYPTDFRMTPAGARRTAQAMADTLATTQGFADIPKTLFETRQTGTTILPSDMRNILQRHCLGTLPEVETPTYATTRFQSGGVAADTSIFGAVAARSRVVLLGTDYTGGTVGNLAGFLSEFSGLDVQEYTVDDGGGFAAISSYLTSRAFQDARPAYLIWVNPVFESLADRGDQPMRELIAAAGAGCSATLPLATGFDQSALSADLRSLEPGRPFTLYLEADGAEAREARFEFLSPSGLSVTRQVLRHPAQVPTGRFYMPMPAQTPGGIDSVRITLDVAIGINARVSACYD